MPDSNDSLNEAFRIDGRVAVVTGAVGILGSVYCRALAEGGATVVVSDLDQEKCDAFAAELPGDQPHIGLAVDLSSEEAIVAWATRINEQFGAADILVNNAATKTPNLFNPLPEFPLEDWKMSLDVNLTAVFLAVRELGPAMVEKGKGSIINIASIYGVVGPDQRIYEGSYYEAVGGPISSPFVYSAAKGAIVAMTKYLATYWGDKGVRTNTITPGGVGSGQNNTFTDKYSSRVPMGRMAEANELGGALLYLASDASSYVNGHNLVVDGGWTAW